jgi:hypothetical protein
MPGPPVPRGGVVLTATHADLAREHGVARFSASAGGDDVMDVDGGNAGAFDLVEAVRD